jgi:hypothetical protein
MDHASQEAKSVQDSLLAHDQTLQLRDFHANQVTPLFITGRLIGFASVLL